MTDNTGTRNVPEPEGEALIQKPGGLIRASREASGMTQAQVGEALHLTVHYIKSLENDEYSKLPGLTFVKGYIRSYARLLKLDEAAIIECYEKYVATLGLQVSRQEQSIRVRRRNDQAILWAVVAGVILVVGLVAGWWFFGREDSAPVVATVAVRVPERVNTIATPVPQTPAVARPSAVAAVRPDPDTAVAAPAMALATEENTGTPAAQSLPNTTTLMTEDGPLVLANAPVDGATTTAQPETDAALAPAEGAVAADLAGAVTTELAGETAAAAESSDLAITSTGTNTRRVELVGDGADQLELQFSGNSWVEVDDEARVRLYSDMMRDGDALSIKAAAPFHILLGDATGVAVLLNGQPLPIAASIRSDKTARITISAEGVSAWAVE